MGEALKIMKDLEANAASVVDPTSYVIAQARKAGSTGGAAAGKEPSFGGPPFDADASLRKRIRWLNDHAAEIGLKGPLMHKEVAPDLLHIGHRDAMTVLKELELNAPSIDNPTDWVVLQSLSRFK